MAPPIKPTVTADADALVKLFTSVDSLNKGRPQDNPRGFSGPEARNLAAYVAEHLTDFVVVTTTRVKAPAWYVIDLTTGKVTTGKKKSDELAAWMARYDIPTGKADSERFWPAGLGEAQIRPGMSAYSVSYRAGLATVYTLQLIPGEFLTEHLGADRAAQVREVADQEDTSEGETVTADAA